MTETPRSSWSRIAVRLVLLTLLTCGLAGVLASCGSEDLTFPGSAIPTSSTAPTPTPTP